MAAMVLLALVAGTCLAEPAPPIARRLLPMPRDLRWGKEDFVLSGPVLLVGAQRHPRAAEVVKEALKGIQLDTIDSTPSAAGKTSRPFQWNAVVLLGKESSAEYPTSSTRTVKALPGESYVLEIKFLDGRPFVSLAGSDDAGTFYAAQTLRQLLETGPALRTVTIWDYPAFEKERGYGECFYGRPWSHEERKAAFRFMGQVKMNLYMYSPKDDPYNRAKWRDDYPTTEMERMKDLIDCARDNFTTFSFAMQPGLSIQYSSDADFRTLMHKFHAVRELGATNLSLQLDDIPREMLNPEDQKRFPNLGDAHAYLANRVWHEIKRVDPACGFSYCPVMYYIAEPDAYLLRMGEALDPEIPTHWTGSDVCDPDITLDEVYAFASGIRRKPFLWDNYPVNDYATNRLFMGPLVNRRAELVQHLYNGFLENPMNQEEASKIPLATIADWAWNPFAYDPERSWENAIRMVAGESGYEAMRLFCEQNRSSFLEPRESIDLVSLVDGYTSGPRAETRQPLRGYLGRLAHIDRNLQETVANKALLAEIGPWVNKLVLYGRAGELKLQIDELSSRSPGDARLAKVRSELADLRARIKAMPQEICGGAMEKLLDR